MTPPKKYPQNLHTQKIFIFLKTLKNIEIQNFEPPKMTLAYVCMKISEYPTPLGVYSHFFLHIGSGSASTVHPKINIRNFKHPQKIFEILARTQKISPILFLDLKGDGNPDDYYLLYERS